MYTVEKLLEISTKAEREYKELLNSFPPGTYNKDRNDARDLMFKAEICAKYMKDNGIEEIANVGPFESTIVKKGQRVRIKPGSYVRSTHPSKLNGTISRARIITVYSVNNGFCSIFSGEITNGSITWVGSGGYFFSTDINNVETGLLS